jgi:ABC-type transport system involved in multi-copper enzyme maturation permease subunit
MSGTKTAIGSRLRAIRDVLGALPASARMLAGRKAPWLALLPTAFPLLFYVMALLSPGSTNLDETAVPALLLGLPMSVLAIFLGVRIVAGEIDQGTLEVVYTVPGGPAKVWTPKLIVSALIVAAAEVPAAAVVFFLLTGFPADALYAAYQGALFHLVVSMGLAAWCRGEITGALATVPVLGLSFMTWGVRVSPFWSVTAARQAEPAEIVAALAQNRIGYALAIAAVVALGYARANRRERMLGS